MTGTVIESLPAKRGMAVLLSLVAGGLCALAIVFQSVHLAVVAILPLALGVVNWARSEPSFRFAISEEGLLFELPDPIAIRYDEVLGVTAPRPHESDRFAIQIYHPSGVIRIPSRITASSRALYQFVLSQLPITSTRASVDVPSSLRSFVAEQVKLFGDDKVYLFLARPHPPISSHRQYVAYSIAVAVVGLIWIAVGVISNSEATAWIGVGVALALVGSVCTWGFSRMSGANRVSNWQDSCLVISPGGIALLQGPLHGKMRWDELRRIEFPAKSHFGLATPGGVNRGIGLQVEGAYLVIADYYDRPLALIHARLWAYWREPGD